MAFNTTLESLCVQYFGMEIYGSVNETEYFQTDPGSNSSCNFSSDSATKTASRTLYTADGGDDVLSEKLDGRNTFGDELLWFLDDQGDIEDYSFISTAGDSLSKSLSVECLGLEKYGFISTPNFSKSLSVEYLGLEKYGYINTPDALLKSLSIGSLGLETYGFVAEDETYEADTSEQEEEEDKESSVSSKSCVGVSCLDRLLQYLEKNCSWSELIQGGGEDEDPDERYKRFSKGLKVFIPAPEKYEGCDIEANKFFSDYYPTKSGEVEV